MGPGTETAAASPTPARLRSPASPSTSLRTCAGSGNGGTGGNGGTAAGGFGGNGATGGRGGNATGGTGGDGGFSSFGIGGGIHNANNASLVINPRLHARKGSSQSKATDLITSNQALAATGGAPGTGRLRDCRPGRQP